MTGSSFFDYVHQADHQELADQVIFLTTFFFCYDNTVTGFGNLK